MPLAAGEAGGGWAGIRKGSAEADVSPLRVVFITTGAYLPYFMLTYLRVPLVRACGDFRPGSRSTVSVMFSCDGNGYDDRWGIPQTCRYLHPLPNNWPCCNSRRVRPVQLFQFGAICASFLPSLSLVGRPDILTLALPRRGVG